MATKRTQTPQSILGPGSHQDGLVISITSTRSWTATRLGTRGAKCPCLEEASTEIKDAGNFEMYDENGTSRRRKKPEDVEEMAVN